MSALIPDFPDLKLHKILDDVSVLGVGATKVNTITFPQDTLAFIETINFDWLAGVSAQINYIRADGANMLKDGGTGNFGATARNVAYTQWLKEILDRATVALTTPQVLLPVRNTLSIEIQSNGGGTINTQIWAYMHQDVDKEFQTQASRQ